MSLLENQHQTDKQGALKRQQEMYEKELDNLRKQLVPATQRGSGPADTAYYSDMSPGSEGSGGESSSTQRWTEERYLMMAGDWCWCVYVLHGFLCNLP